MEKILIVILEACDFKSCEVHKTKTVNMGSMFELSYIINLKDNIKEKEFIDKIRMRNSNLKVVLERVTDSYDL